MQATYALRKVSITPLLVAFAVLAALILGGAGGYWLKSSATQVPTTARIHAQVSPALVTDSWESRLGVGAGELHDSRLTVSTKPVPARHDSSPRLRSLAD